MDAQDVRIGLVLNGGVSLAVWMGGVVHELNRMLGRSTAARGWAPIRGDQRVIVDVVAGTSAGGLNGAVLASAIARGTELPHLLELWQQQARLDKGHLLKTMKNQAGVDPSHGQSVLSGDFFEQQILDLVKGVKPGIKAGEKPQDMCLLVTATALRGGLVELREGDETILQITDRRRVYKFARNENRKVYNPTSQLFEADPHRDAFEGQDVDKDLARAARASAGFPIAFGPVWESPSLQARAVTPDNTPSWLIDGGVLDNAPFIPLFDHLERTPVEHQSTRCVLYVTPSVAQRSPISPLAGSDAAPPWVSILASLWDLRGEADLTSAIRSLRDHAARSKASTSDILNLLGSAVSTDGHQALSKAADVLLPAYRRMRVDGLLKHEFELKHPDVAAHRVDEADIEMWLRNGFYSVPTSLRPAVNGQWQWGLRVASRMLRWASRAARRDNEMQLSARICAAEHEVGALTEYVDAVVARSESLAAAASVVVKSGILKMLARQMDNIVTEWGEHWNAPAEHLWAAILAVEVITQARDFNTGMAPPPFDLRVISPESPRAHQLLFGSLDDAKPLFGSPEESGSKLYGTRLGHFAAFVDDHWRAHDWIWGRLDAALALVRLFDGPAGGVNDELVKELLLDILWEECEILTGAPAIDRATPSPEILCRALYEKTRTAVHLTDEQIRAQAWASAQVDSEELINRVFALPDELADTFSGPQRWAMEGAVRLARMLVENQRAGAVASLRADRLDWLG